MSEKYSRLKEPAIAALLASSTIVEASAKIGVDESTLRAWMKEPDFQSEFRQARRDLVIHAVAKLCQHTGAAIETLFNALNDDNANARVRAADLLLSHAAKWVESVDLIEEISQLREMIEAQKNGNT